MTPGAEEETLVWSQRGGEGTLLSPERDSPNTEQAVFPSLNAAGHLRLSCASVLKACSWYVVLKHVVEYIQIVVFCLSFVSADATNKKK